MNSGLGGIRRVGEGFHGDLGRQAEGYGWYISAPCVLLSCNDSRVVEACVVIHRIDAIFGFAVRGTYQYQKTSVKV